MVRLVPYRSGKTICMADATVVFGSSVHGVPTTVYDDLQTLDSITSFSVSVRRCFDSVVQL